MLQGLAQFCVALLDFLEQPHVLDGDDRLIGEGFEKLDLPFRETAGSGRMSVNAPSALPLRIKGAPKIAR